MEQGKPVDVESVKSNDMFEAGRLRHFDIRPPAIPEMRMKDIRVLFFGDLDLVAEVRTPSYRV